MQVIGTIIPICSTICSKATTTQFRYSKRRRRDKQNTFSSRKILVEHICDNRGRFDKVDSDDSGMVILF